MSRETETASTLDEAVQALAAIAAGEAEAPSDDVIARVLLQAVAAASALWEDGAPELELPDDVPPTAVARVAGALLQAADMELFELALWQMWGGNRERGRG